MRFGLHLSFSKAPALAAALHSQTVQVFCGNPRGWQKTALSAEFIESFTTAATAAKLDTIVVHATYLINLAAVNDEFYLKSCEAFVVELLRCKQIGARFYVLHIGNHMGAGHAAGRKRVEQAMRIAEKEVPDGPMILCENTCGSGTTLGGTFEEVAAVLDEARYPKLGMCLDTCHALAAGYDIRTSAGVSAMLDTIERTVGLKRLHCLHLNDSKGALGSKLDRHASIGEGEIGLAGFRALLSDKRLWPLPAILETPKDTPTSDVDNLWRIVDLAVETGAVKRADVGTKPVGVTTPSDEDGEKPASKKPTGTAAKNAAKSPPAKKATPAKPRK